MGTCARHRARVDTSPAPVTRAAAPARQKRSARAGGAGSRRRAHRGVVWRRHAAARGGTAGVGRGWLRAAAGRGVGQRVLVRPAAASLSGVSAGVRARRLGGCARGDGRAHPALVDGGLTGGGEISQRRRAAPRGGSCVANPPRVMRQRRTCGLGHHMFKVHG